MNFPYVCSKCGVVEFFCSGTCPLCGGKLVRKQEQEPNMYEELKAWADKWGIPYTIEEDPDGPVCDISFGGPCYFDATFSYNKKDKTYIWYGGD